jgi:hypothetical protein
MPDPDTATEKTPHTPTPAVARYAGLAANPPAHQQDETTVAGNNTSERADATPTAGCAPRHQ